MKATNACFRRSLAAGALAALTFSLSACHQASAPTGYGQAATDATLAKRRSTAVDSGVLTARYVRKWEAYKGGKIKLSQGSQFWLRNGSLTPPAELQGTDVAITMSVHESGDTLLFQFGPHGCQFDPPATVRLHYTGASPTLYYIEADGAYTEQPPDEVDARNQWLIIHIRHFSRYAVALSNGRERKS